jgi:hypothetical protein
MKPQKAERVLDRLKAEGLVEYDETGTHPHNWAGRQYKSDAKIRRLLNGCDGTVTGSVTTA